MLADLMRVFGCEGSNPYILGGLLLFFAGNWVFTHFKPLGWFGDRISMVIVSTLGVFAGAFVFMLLHDGCVAR